MATIPTTSPAIPNVAPPFPPDVNFGRQCTVFVYAPNNNPLAPVGPAALANMAQFGPYATNNGSIALTINGTPDPELGEGFRVVFRSWQGSTVTPGEITIRIYNVSYINYNLIKGEFQRVAIQAGYTGNTALVFDGLIRQVLWGHENAVDSYVDIIASDNDDLFGAIVQGTVRGPVGFSDQLRMLTQASGLTTSDVEVTGQQPVALPRGKTWYGAAGDYGRSLAQGLGGQLFSERGKLVLVPVAGYRTSVDVVEVTPQTGLIGFPELTPEGMNITTLINPRLRLGGLLHLNADFNRLPTPAEGPVLRQLSSDQLAAFTSGRQPLFAQPSGTGYYKIAVIEHEGDTRGDPWYSHIVCFAASVDLPAASACSINPGGAG